MVQQLESLSVVKNTFGISMTISEFEWYDIQFCPFHGKQQESEQELHLGMLLPRDRLLAAWLALIFGYEAREPIRFYDSWDWSALTMRLSTRAKLTTNWSIRYIFWKLTFKNLLPETVERVIIICREFFASTHARRVAIESFPLGRTVSKASLVLLWWLNDDFQDIQLYDRAHIVEFEESG